MNIIIIHGAYGSPDENWFPWLRNRLKNKGHDVFVPKLPTPKDQSLENWKKEYDNQVTVSLKDVIFIGHSLGPSFILNLLERGHKAKACFFVAPFMSLLGNTEFDEINKTFVNHKIDYQAVFDNCKRFYIYASNNDPYVPLEESTRIANQLKTGIILKKGMGHFNKDAGVTSAEFLWSNLENEIGNYNT